MVAPIHIIINSVQAFPLLYSLANTNFLVFVVVMVSIISVVNYYVSVLLICISLITPFHMPAEHLFISHLPLNKCLGVFLFVCFYWWGYTRV
jgi:hypothetical protein